TLVIVPSAAVVSVEEPMRCPKATMLRWRAGASAVATGFEDAQPKRSSPIIAILITAHYPTCIASIRLDRLRFLTAGISRGTWMNRKNAGIVFALCLLGAGT